MTRLTVAGPILGIGFELNAIAAVIAGGVIILAVGLDTYRLRLARRGP